MPYNGAMATMDDIARVLRLSKRAVRRRIDALDGMLDLYLQRGENNRLIFTNEALAILRRLEELRYAEKLPIRQAAARVRGEVGSGDIPLPESGAFVAIPEVAFLRRMIKVIAEERDRWREAALTLKAALPPELQWLTDVYPAESGDERLN